MPEDAAEAFAEEAIGTKEKGKASKTRPWHKAEDQMLVQLQKTLGNKWAKIADQLPGRTGSSVRNHWATLQRQKKEKGGQEPLEPELSDLIDIGDGFTDSFLVGIDDGSKAESGEGLSLNKAEKTTKPPRKKPRKQQRRAKAHVSAPYICRHASTGVPVL